MVCKSAASLTTYLSPYCFLLAMFLSRQTSFAFLWGVFACLFCGAVAATTLMPGGANPVASYVLADSIGLGLSQGGLESKLQAQLGGVSRISVDGGRSITTRGNGVKKTALESVEADQAFIAQAGVIILILGMNQMEASFADSQQQLMQKLKALAPKAKYYWVDIGATIANQVPGWNARNKTIYDNANKLGYAVVSRYRAIFGPDADPLNITPGKNFPGWLSEAGYGSPGNIHGFDGELSQALLAAVTGGKAPQVKAPKPSCSPQSALPPVESIYILGDSIALGLGMEGLERKLQANPATSVKISDDSGRSITTPGSQIKESALESVEADKAYIATASVIIVILGTNQLEVSFKDSQRELMWQLKNLAPKAKYYWVDIGATMSTQAAAWSARNKVIYDNAALLGYSVISRYKAIFGPDADPLNITPGRIFPGLNPEQGFDDVGNVHGAYRELMQVVLDTVLGKRLANTEN